MYRHVRVFPRPLTFFSRIARSAMWPMSVGPRGRTPIQYHQPPQPYIGARSAQGPLRAPATTTHEESQVSKIRISKRHRPAGRPAEPLSADPRDRDIMRAKQIAIRSRPPGAAPRARDAEPGQELADAEDQHAWYLQLRTSPASRRAG